MVELLLDDNIFVFQIPICCFRINKLPILIPVDLLCYMSKFNSDFSCVYYSKVYGECKSGQESVIVFKRFIM